MKKLIELLSECTNGRFKTEDDLKLCIEMRGYCKNFIKWLVENDKIDRDKVKRESRKFFVGELRPRTPRYKLLILLSISDTPIDDLISYLR